MMTSSIPLHLVLGPSPQKQPLPGRLPCSLPCLPCPCVVRPSLPYITSMKCSCPPSWPRGRERNQQQPRLGKLLSSCTSWGWEGGGRLVRRRRCCYFQMEETEGLALTDHHPFLPSVPHLPLCPPPCAPCAEGLVHVPLSRPRILTSFNDREPLT